MTKTEQCTFPGCSQAAAASLDGEALCREHFIFVCYQRLDRYDEIRKDVGLSVSDTESVRRFIHECTRDADEIEHTGQGLENQDRAKLLYIILSASELGCHVRRSPRKVAAIPVRLSSEKLGGAWEEDTETVLVSRYGALVRCKHSAKAGENIHVLRADTGQQALAALFGRPGDPHRGRVCRLRKFLGTGLGSGRGSSMIAAEVPPPGSWNAFRCIAD